MSTRYIIGGDGYTTVSYVTATYSGPTDTRGSRMVARAVVDGRRVQTTVPYDYAASDPYAVAARALADRVIGPGATLEPYTYGRDTRAYRVTLRTDTCPRCGRVLATEHGPLGEAYSSCGYCGIVRAQIGGSVWVAEGTGDPVPGLEDREYGGEVGA